MSDTVYKAIVFDIGKYYSPWIRTEKGTVIYPKLNYSGRKAYLDYIKALRDNESKALKREGVVWYVNNHTPLNYKGDEAMNKFEIGQLVATTGATETYTQNELLQYLARHRQGDWGDMCDEDKKANEDALEYGERLMSCYEEDGKKLWIITEYDRSVTTLLLPSEY